MPKLAIQASKTFNEVTHQELRVQGQFDQDEERDFELVSQVVGTYNDLRRSVHAAIRNLTEVASRLDSSATKAAEANDVMLLHGATTFLHEHADVAKDAKVLDAQIRMMLAMAAQNKPSGK